MKLAGVLTECHDAYSILRHGAIRCPVCLAEVDDMGIKLNKPLPNTFAEGGIINSPMMPTTLRSDDPFESALIEIVKMNRAKRKDYAIDSRPFSNFETTSGIMSVEGFGPIESALFNVVQKIARLQSLRSNGRMNETANKSVMDTYLDLAVYSCIVYAIAKSETD